jgi:hypothetical protein
MTDITTTSDTEVLKYKIIELDTTQHSMVVRFYSSVITEEMLATDILDGVIRRCRTDYSFDLPIPEPTGDDLVKFISDRAPKDWFKLLHAVADPTVDTSLTALQPLLNVEMSLPLSDAPASNPVVIPISSGTA